MRNLPNNLKFGLVGFPLTHSFSETFFKEMFAEKKISANYQLYPIVDFSVLRQNIAEFELNGFNVTIPFKEKIIPFCNTISDEAREIGAVNCVAIKNQQWIGHNTDAVGFKTSFETKFGELKNANALIFGTGGSSKAVQNVLANANCRFSLVSRFSQKGITYEQIKQIDLSQFDLLINTTPVGMFPNIEDFLPINFSKITKKHTAIDLIYNPSETVFLKNAKQNGAFTLNGLNMLHEQAKASWFFWLNNCF